MRNAEPVWRAIAVYRFASIGYAVLLVALNRADYSRPDLARVVIAAMAAWTAVTTVTAGLLLSTAAPQYRTPCTPA